MSEYEELLEKKYNCIKQKEELDKEIKEINEEIKNIKIKIEEDKEKAESIFEEIKENLKKLNSIGFDLYYKGYIDITNWDYCHIYKTEV